MRNSLLHNRTLIDPAGVSGMALAADGAVMPEEFEAALATSLVRGPDTAIIGLTSDGLIVTWSRGAELLYGYGAMSVLGQPITILDPPEVPTGGEHFDTALSGNAVRLKAQHERLDGSRVDVQVTILPVRCDNGSIIGTACVVEDLGERARGAHSRERRPIDSGREWSLSEQQERRELIEASARAESANRAKSEFLARMSRELRSPLNTILGFGQLLELEELGPRERDHVALILNAARKLLEEINAVLDVANIEAGQITLSPEPVALGDVIRYVFALVAPLAREREVSLELNTEGLTGEGRVDADRNRLNQVILNLLSNAIRYNRVGGRVSVSFSITSTGRIRTSIADTGTGIGPEQLAKLFDPFERLGAELTEIEGTGLGLTLSRGLIEAMGGTIEVSSQPGAGTTFVVELAAARLKHAERPRVEPEGDLPSLDSPAGVVSHIMYIEDNVSNLTLVERILEGHPGVELIPAMQATIGLELAREHRPDLIVLDLHLPDMPGTEVLERLKAEHPSVPVIVLTADAREGQEERVRQLGAADYLTKPLDVHRFVEVLAVHLNDDSTKRRSS